MCRSRNTDMDHVVIIGAGHAGVQAADSLRAEGYAGRLTILSEEDEAPYQRPPLSKDFMLGSNSDVLLLRGDRFFVDKDVDLRLGCRADRVDPAARRVVLQDGTALPYDELILATGSSNRQLDWGIKPPRGVLHDLRTARDARALRALLPGARHAVIVGAGFVGLEFAAAARKAHLSVTVLEFSGRVMSRVLSPVMSGLFRDMHEQTGVELRFHEGAAGIEEAGKGSYRVRTTTGAAIDADLVLCGIGAVPNTQLAAAAGLQVKDGIVVDAGLRTSCPHIWAIGDCARYPSRYAGGLVRLESVQNAVDQGRHVAKGIINGPTPYVDVPWFWTIQGDYKLQIAGIARSGDVAVWRERGVNRGSVFCFHDGHLSAVESLNWPGDHVAARAVLGLENDLGPATVAREDFDLKRYRAGLSGR